MKRIESTDRRDELIDEVRELEKALNRLIEKVNGLIEEVNEAIEGVREAATTLDEKIDELGSWVEEKADEIESYIDDRSEKWQESERGQQYAEWYSQWSAIYFERAIECVPEQIDTILEVTVGSDAISDVEGLTCEVDNV